MTESESLPPGYQVYEYDDPFEDHVGPLGHKVVDGKITFAFLAVIAILLGRFMAGC